MKYQVIHLGTRKRFCHKMSAQEWEETDEQEKSEFVFGRKHFQATSIRWPQQQGKQISAAMCWRRYSQ